jgi:hypothetical protein
MQGLRLGGAFFLALTVSVSLPAQESRVSVHLFGLASSSLGQLSAFRSTHNVYEDSWDSYQDVVFDKSPLRLGWGAGLTYWMSRNFGLEIEARGWSARQPSRDNAVHIEYSYYPWYPYPSDEPVHVSSDLESPLPPELSFRVYAFSLNGLWREKVGPLFLEISGGLTSYQVGGGFKDLYLYRTIPSSHGTFQSGEIVFATRFDFWSLGGNLGAGLAVPLGGNWEGFLGLKYFFGGSRDPEMLVESMEGLNGAVMSVVIPGIDDIKAHVRYGAAAISPSSLSVNLGLRFRPTLTLAPENEGKRLRLIVELGGSRLDPDLSLERTQNVTAEGSRFLTQEIGLFNRKVICSFGLGAGWRLSPRWGLELLYRHRQKAAAVDSGPIVLTEEGGWESVFRYQRPRAELKMDEWTFSLVRSFPIPGAEILVSAGANLARVSLPLTELYFQYFYEPWTSDFVSFSGLYSTSGTAWTWGAQLGLGLRFTITGPLEARIMGRYNLYRKAQVPTDAAEFVLDEETWGFGNLDQLTPDMLKTRPAEFPLDPSGFELAFSLGVVF